MAKKAFPYGVLAGTVVGHLRDADDDHYQILVSAGSAMYGSQATKPSDR